MTKKRIIKKAAKRFRQQLRPLAEQNWKMNRKISGAYHLFGRESEQYKALVEEKEVWKKENHFKVTPLLRKAMVFLKRERMALERAARLSSFRQALMLHEIMFPDNSKEFIEELKNFKQ